MFFILIFISFLFKSGVGHPFLKVNETYQFDLHIVGGSEAIPHSLPYQAAIIVDSNLFCGGVLISTKHVLTVAHCILNRSTTEVILGAHNIDIFEDTQKIFHNPSAIVHANYDSETQKDDIALIVLNKKVQITHAIRPIKSLADEDSGNFLGADALLSGWGYTKTHSNIQSKLRQVHLDIIDNQKCYLFYEDLITKLRLCTCGEDNVVGKVGACFGDSGNPLVVENTLVGLVSFGSQLCETGYPTVYTRISAYRDWIAKYSGI